MSFAGLDIQVWNTLLEKIGPQVEDAGYEFLSDDPQWDLQTQISDWESWITRGDVKAIMGYPVQSDSMVTVTQQAQQSGVEVLGYASQWEGTSAAVLIDNRTDGINLGEAMGEWINDKYGKGTEVPVALLGYWDTDLGRERSEGIVEGLENVDAAVSLTEHSVVSLDDGYKAAQNQLAAVPDTKVWVSMGPDPPRARTRRCSTPGWTRPTPPWLWEASTPPMRSSTSSRSRTRSGVCSTRRDWTIWPTRWPTSSSPPRAARNWRRRPSAPSA